MSERKVATGKALCHITKGNFESTLGTSSSLTTYLIRSKIGSNTGTCKGTFFDLFKFFDVESTGAPVIPRYKYVQVWRMHLSLHSCGVRLDAPTGTCPPPLAALGVIGFPVCDYCLSLFHGAVRYRRYRYVTVQHGHRHLHGDPITATGGWKLLKYV